MRKSFIHNENIENVSQSCYNENLFRQNKEENSLSRKLLEMSVIKNNPDWK